MFQGQDQGKGKKYYLQKGQAFKATNGVNTCNACLKQPVKIEPGFAVCGIAKKIMGGYLKMGENPFTCSEVPEEIKISDSGAGNRNEKKPKGEPGPKGQCFW